MVRKRLANVAPFSDTLPLLSSPLPPLSPTTHLSHLEPTCKRPPRGAFLSLFHGLSLACCTIIITSPHSSSLLLFLLEPFLFQTSLSLFHLFYLFTSLLFLLSVHIFFYLGNLSGLGREQRSVENFEGHFLIQPSCTLLYFSCIISTQQKGCPSRSERCSYSKMSLSMWVGQSFSKKAMTSGSRRAPTNLLIGFPSRKAMTVGKAVT